MRQPCLILLPPEDRTAVARYLEATDTTSRRVIVATSANLRGRTLEPGDQVVELPGFRDRDDADLVLDALEPCFAGAAVDRDQVWTRA